MLVTFKSTAFGDITMFGDVAKSLLKMMGQSGEVPGAILGPDVAEALETLQENLSKTQTDAPAVSADSDDESDQAVSLSTRASPLIGGLEEAVAAKADVIWES